MLKKLCSADFSINTEDVLCPVTKVTTTERREVSGKQKEVIVTNSEKRNPSLKLIKLLPPALLTPNQSVPDACSLHRSTQGHGPFHMVPFCSAQVMYVLNRANFINCDTLTTTFIVNSVHMYCT